MWCCTIEGKALAHQTAPQTRPSSARKLWDKPPHHLPQTILLYLHLLISLVARRPWYRTPLASWVFPTTFNSDSTCCCISCNLLSASCSCLLHSAATSSSRNIAQPWSPLASNSPPREAEGPAEGPWSCLTHQHLSAPILTSLLYYTPILT